MTLNSHILFSTEAPTIWNLYHIHQILREIQQLGNLFSIFIGPLSLRKNFDAFFSIIFPRSGHTTFCFKKSVFDSLGVVSSSGDKGGILESLEAGSCQTRSSSMGQARVPVPGV